MYIKLINMVGFSGSGDYGNATRSGSTLDVTEYRDSKYAKAFYAALLDPEAKTIKRKSGTKWPKRQHTLVYDAVPIRIQSKNVTAEMTLKTSPKSITSPDQWVCVLKPVLNASKTFHAQVSFPAPVIDKPSEIPVTMKQKRKTARLANIEGTRRYNNHRDW